MNRARVGSYEYHLDQAINYANIAISRLRDADAAMGRARLIGASDILGGGKFITFLKRTQSYAGEKGLKDADRAIRNFRKEMAEMGKVSKIKLEYKNPILILDYIFDNFIVDTLIQKQVKKNQKAARSVIKELEEELIELEREKRRLN
ncbi:MAG: hypothetical protein SPI59_05625 [Finegoldia sp.]|nr:hypothetical protein [Finegoldia sp.]